MSNSSYKKKKKESFSSKVVNFILTIIVACGISSQICTAANNNLRLAQVSDAHFSSYEENTSYKLLKKSPQLLEDVIFQLNTSGPYDCVIFTGDLVNTPQESELRKFLGYAKNINYDWYAINGNHDVAIGGDLTKKKFINILREENRSMRFDNPYYAFTPKKGFRVICLDSIIDNKITTNGEISEEEYKWLKTELDNNGNKVVILCTHVPIEEPFSSENHRLNNEAKIKGLLRGYTNPIIVLQGHYHAVMAKQKNNIIYVSCPSLVTYPNSYRVVNINSNKKRTMVDIFLKETNLKDVQSRAKLRVLGSEMLSGSEQDRNITFEIKRGKE
ncbi:MAG: metallophosphoesterase [bacterium]|nr:metallophosphoesterase [bacterium]